MARRRANGEGAYERHATTGKYRLVLRTEGKRRVGPWALSRSEARAAAAQKFSQSEAEKRHRPRSFGEIVEWAITERFAHKNAPATTDTDRYTAAKLAQYPIWRHQVPAPGTAAFDDFAADLQDTINAIPGSSSQRRKAALLAQKSLRESGLALSLSMPAIKRGHKALLSEDDKAALWRAAETREERLLLGLMLDAGLRRGELCGVMFSDHQDGILRLKRSVKQVRIDGVSSLLIDGLKTKASYNPIPLPASVADLFAGRRDQVFVASLSAERPMAPWSVRNIVRRLAKRAQIEVEVTPQTLRGTFEQTIVDEIRDPALAAELLRHSVQVAASHYLRATSERMMAARAALDARMSPKTSPIQGSGGDQEPE